MSNKNREPAVDKSPEVYIPSLNTRHVTASLAQIAIALEGARQSWGNAENTVISERAYQAQKDLMCALRDLDRLRKCIVEARAHIKKTEGRHTRQLLPGFGDDTLAEVKTPPVVILPGEAKGATSHHQEARIDPSKPR